MDDKSVQASATVQAWVVHANCNPLPPDVDRASMVFESDGHLVPPGVECEFCSRRQDVFRADTIEIGPEVAPLFELVAIKVGNRSMSGPSTLPCSACCPSAPLLLDAAAPGQDIGIIVRNISDKPALFRATLHGGHIS